MMKYSIVVICLLSLALIASARFQASSVMASIIHRNLTSTVDTRIGSGGGGYGIGMTASQAQVPFGNIRIGPDTSLGLEPLFLQFDDMQGYYDGNHFIECFSHTHLVGAGIGDYQNIGFMPTRELKLKTIKNSGYRSRFSHATETALPGYYAVNLDSWDVFAETTVSGTHAGMHRYTYHNKSDEDQGQFLLLDLCHAAPRGFVSEGGKACKEAEIFNISQDPQNQEVVYVEGRVFTSGSFTGRSKIGGVNIFIKARITAPAGSIIATTVWEDRAFQQSLRSANTTSGSLGVIFTFLGGASPQQATIHVAISFISQQHAAMNLETQGQDPKTGTWFVFEDAVQSTVNEWEEILSRVQVGNFAQQDAGHLKSFYSSIYRAHQVPSTYSESNGDFLGEDYRINKVPEGRRFLSDLSIWDIYRSQAPLMTITAPDVARDMVMSMMIMYNETGKLPKWTLANVETGCMVGLHSAIIMADNIMKGVGELPPFDVVYSAISEGISGQNEQLQEYGFVPVETNKRGSSLTLDYAVDAGALYNLAEYMGNATAMNVFRFAAQSYRNVWDSSSTYFFPKSKNGTFMNLWAYLPYPLSRHYTEGNAAQYRWYVPHDLKGLVSLFPNASFAASQLNEFFLLSEKWPRFLNTTLPNWAYWAGNEPDILAPFIFNFMGNEYAHLTQTWVPFLLQKYYYPDPAGVPGNDDYGTMSSWVIFSNLGLYPVASTRNYSLCVPQFDSIEVNIPVGGSSPWRFGAPVSNRTQVLRVTAHNRPTSPASKVYIANVTVNGITLREPIVNQELLLKSSPAELNFYLTDEPTVFGAPSPKQGGPQPFFPVGLPPSTSFEEMVPSKEILQQILSMDRKDALRRHMEDLLEEQ